MYSTIKKLSLTFVFLNVFMFQSLMADMMFYYSAAILPSIIASKQQVPVELRAETDYVQPQTIEFVTIDVLTNDTIPGGSTINILLEEYQDMYNDGVQRYEGLWLVVGNTVTFTPDANFSGGQVDIQYQITDQYGNTSKNDIIIQYPVFVQAISDFLEPANIEPVTINVLANDTIAEGTPVNVLLEVDGANGTEYFTTIDAYDGTWNVETNQSITFTPNANFSGGTVWMQYQITDQDGHKSTTWIDIEYPIFLAAVYDYLEVNDTSIPTTIDVLANDVTSGGATVTSLLLGDFDYNTGLPVFTSQITTNEGTWTVVDDQIVFTPSSGFGGGTVYMEYQIIDDMGHIATEYITIQYPVFVQAEYDFVQPANIEPVTINVLENDTIKEGSTVNVLLEVYGQNGYEYVTNVDAYDGMWNVEANQSITFTPNASFNGGYVSIQYQITDQDGHKSTTWMDIEYPILIDAVYDYLEVNDTSIPTTIDVLANDVITGGATVTSLLLVDFDYDIGLPVFTSQITSNEGTWTVVDDQIVFTPSSGFGGGTVYMEYQIIDDMGHIATEYITIQYPVFVQAEYDFVQPANIEPVTINVLENDTIKEGSTVNVLLEVNGQNGYEYVTSIDAYDGMWNVEANQSITFTPNASFNGGTVSMQYQIMDQDGHKSTTWVNIEYPVFLYAEWDNVQSQFIEPVSVAVLANDTIADGVTLSSVLLVNYDYNTGTEETGNTFVTYQGTWSVNANQVVFEPNSTFGGGYVNMQYLISDEEGHSSSSVVQIEYPLTATPVCDVSKTELVDLDGIYNAVADNISFIVQDGRRNFEAELDTDSYVVSSDFFTTASVITTLNPLYFVEYEDANTSYETRAELDLTQVNIIDSNNTWNYQGERIENDRGFKTIRLEGEDGDYTLESDSSLKLMIESSPVFNFKAVRTISVSEINNILGAAGISLTLDSGDTAQLILTKSLENRYWWNDQSWESEVYGSLQEYITSKEYNSSSPYFSGGVLYREGAQASIVFTENSSGMSGTLVEVSYQDNTLLTDAAGTWSIVEITDEGNTYNVLVLEPTLCGYSKALYKLDDNGYIIRGDEEEVLGEISAEFSFSDSLKEKLKTFFIDNAVLDVDPVTPASPVITDAMLAGKTFYVVNDRGDGTFDYELITVISTSEVDYREILTDINGNIIHDSSITASYVLDDGRIRIINGTTFSLISLDENQWNMIVDGDDNSPYGTWLLAEPANFPQL